MPSTYKQAILDYCGMRGVAVPPGFGRNTPNRYAVIRTDRQPSKLIATTWFKHADVAYYFEHFLIPEIGSPKAAEVDIYDFKDMKRLRYSGTSRLTEIGEIKDETA